MGDDACRPDVTTSTSDALIVGRPLLRGVLHEIGLIAACVVGTLLIVGVDAGRVPEAAVFASSVVACLTISTLYHRIVWTPRLRYWMRRLDHVGIYLLIAGTYTPVGLISLHGATQVVVLALVWSGTAVAVLLELCWRRAPRWLTVPIAIALGWAGVVALPQLEAHAGTAAVVLLCAGGIAYTAGAVVYAAKRPDPVPHVFGYHELFHALTLVAIACQYVAIAFFVVRAG
jgi:hemolysin III